MNSRFHTLKFLGLLLSAGLVSAPAMAVDLAPVINLLPLTPTASANASATIISPLSITKVNDLNFGDVVASGALGSVVMAANQAGSRTAFDGASTMTTQTGTVSAASFNVTGQNSATYSVTLPVTTTLNAGAGANMLVTAFTSDLAQTNDLVSTIRSGTLSSSGAQTFYVGATLNVTPNQAAGSYTGTFPVIIFYN